MPHRVSFTEKRRARLRKAVDRIDQLESRTTITEPISFTGLSVSALRGLAQLGIAQVQGGSAALDQLAAASRAARQRGSKAAAVAILAPRQASTFLPIAVGSQTNEDQAGTSAPAARAAPGSVPAGDGASEEGDWLSLSSASDESSEPGIPIPWEPAKPASGGPAQARAAALARLRPAQATAQSARYAYLRRLPPQAALPAVQPLSWPPRPAPRIPAPPRRARRARRTRRTRQAPERQAARPESPSIPSTAAQSPARAGRRQAQLHTRSRAIPRARAKGRSHTSRSMFWTGTTGR